MLAHRSAPLLAPNYLTYETDRHLALDQIEFSFYSCIDRRNDPAPIQHFLFVLGKKNKSRKGKGKGNATRLGFYDIEAEA